MNSILSWKRKKKKKRRMQNVLELNEKKNGKDVIIDS